MCEKSVSPPLECVCLRTGLFVFLAVVRPCEPPVQDSPATTPRDVEVANHYLVVHTGQAEFKMRPLFKWAHILKIIQSYAK